MSDPVISRLLMRCTSCNRSGVVVFHERHRIYWEKAMRTGQCIASCLHCKEDRINVPIGEPELTGGDERADIPSVESKKNITCVRCGDPVTPVSPGHCAAVEKGLHVCKYCWSEKFSFNCGSRPSKRGRKDRRREVDVQYFDSLEGCASHDRYGEESFPD